MPRYPVPPPEPPDQAPTLEESLADRIETEAAAFPDAPRFRAACSRILAAAQDERLEQIARDNAFAQLATFLRQLAALGDTDENLAALWAVARQHCGKPDNISALARQHGVSPQAFAQRMHRIARYTGLAYRPRPRKKPRDHKPL